MRPRLFYADSCQASIRSCQWQVLQMRKNACIYIKEGKQNGTSCYYNRMRIWRKRKSDWKKVAQDLGIKFYDRETVDEIIKEVGIPKAIMEKVEEGVTIAGKGAEGDVRGSFSKYADLTERAIHVQKTIIRKLAARESCVIIGRSADYILKEQKPILRIFIYAPDEIRIKNVMESHNLSADDAKLLIVEKDKRYHKRHMALTGSNRGDRHNRDMLINSDLLGVDGTAQLIEEVAGKVFQE